MRSLAQFALALALVSFSADAIVRRVTFVDQSSYGNFLFRGGVLLLIKNASSS